jgi:hypothetical protein
MNTKLKWFSLFLMASFIVACDSGSSSDTDKEEVEDCSIDTDGTVKVFSPKGGEVFHIGDSITVKWGAKYADGTDFRILYYFDEESQALDLTEESVGPEAPKGDQCYSVQVVLDGDDFPASNAAFITVRDYSNGSVSGKSKSFQVVE